MSRMLEIWRHHKILATAFAVMVIITLALGLRLAFFSIYWATHRDLPIEAWMPVGYIARSHGIPVDRLKQVTSGTVGDRDRRSVEEVAGDMGISTRQLIERLESEIATYKQERRSGAGS
ncbi:MAG: hypothetical protein KDJ69_00015 [Nitratireductor sp.]|nr:hypothetical protein [Nitratireductor sp.]